jgi:hypothetical protein
MVGSLCARGNQMTSWSFHHVDETRAALRTIVNDPAYGATALSNVRIMSEVLPSLLRGARLERSVLVTAAKENLASTMLEHVSAGMDPGLAVRLSAHFLATISPIPIDACYRAAAELALALGLISADEADALAFRAADYEGPDGVADADQVDGESAPPAPPETTDLTHPPPADDKTTAPWSADAIPVPGEKQEHSGPSAAPDDDTDEWASRRDGQSDAQPDRQHGYPVSPNTGLSVGQPAYAQPIGLAPTPGPGQEAQLAPLAGEWISHVVRDTVHPGLLAFNPPPEMHQGRTDRIEVGVARSPELRDALTSGFRGRGLPEVLQVDAAPLMGVELRGSSFKIEPLSPPEQLVVPLARWEFDVTPLRSGSQTLALCVTIRIDSPFVSGGQIAVPVFERHIRIKVDVVYGTRRFVANNWQWLAGTAVGLGGGIAAWISLVH